MIKLISRCVYGMEGRVCRARAALTRHHFMHIAGTETHSCTQNTHTTRRQKKIKELLDAKHGGKAATPEQTKLREQLAALRTEWDTTLVRVGVCLCHFVCVCV